VFLKAGPSNELHRTSKTVSLRFTHSHANTHWREKLNQHSLPGVSLSLSFFLALSSFSFSPSQTHTLSQTHARPLKFSDAVCFYGNRSPCFPAVGYLEFFYAFNYEWRGLIIRERYRHMQNE